MVVLDEDGKPCRACNTLTDFQQVMFGTGSSTKAAASSSNSVSNSDMPTPLENAPPSFLQDPPDSFELGQNTWTFLHSVAAYYPQRPTKEQQQEMSQFLTTFSHFYPCKPCAKDFEKYLGEHAPSVESRSALSLWMCDAHNAVNKKLGKQTFDCRYWQARWRDGWEDFLASQNK